MSEFPTLLETAVTQVSVRNVSTEANILLDEGAQRSFITIRDLPMNLGQNPMLRKISPCQPLVQGNLPSGN